MTRNRDVAAFGERAHGYDQGWRGQMHHQIADRAVDLALTCVPAPKRILDVGAVPATCWAGLPPAPRRRRSWPGQASPG